MPLHYKRLLKEAGTNSISKHGENKNKRDSDDGDSLPPNELIAQIDINLRHLKGQKTILKNAKEGKTWGYKLSLSENTEKKHTRPSMNKCNLQCCGQLNDALRKIVEHKSVKVTDSFTQIGSSLNNLNTKRTFRGSVPSRDFHKCTNKNSFFDRNVHLPSEESSLNAEMKIYKYRSSVRKLTSKTQTNVTNKWQKYKIISSEQHSSESRELTPSLESKACERSNFLTKFVVRSQPSETQFESSAFKKRDNNQRKTVKNKTNYTQNSKNLPDCMFAPLSPRNDRQRDTNMTLIQRSRKTTEGARHLERTESSIRRHAKLSKEILDYAKRRREQRASEKSNEYKKHKEKASEVYSRSLKSPKQNVSKNNHDKFSVVSPDSRKSDSKKEHRKDNAEISRSWKSHNIITIKPKVIDDSTYVCPTNSEKNDYLLLPYVGNTSEDNVYFNSSPKPEREHLDNGEKFLEEITSKSVVLLKDASSQQISKPSRSINERKSKTTESDHELLRKEGFSQNPLNRNINRGKCLIQSSDESAYMSHNLESTWESHANREGPLGSKFDMSHQNHIKIPTNYRSHYYDLKDHLVQPLSKRFLQKKHETKLLSPSFKSNSVHTKAASKPLGSDQYDSKKKFHDYNPTKLAPPMEQAERFIPVTELSTNNKASAWNLWQKQIINGASPRSRKIHTPENRCSTQSLSKIIAIDPDKLNLKDNSASTLSWQNEKLSNSFELELNQSSSELGDTNNDFPVKTSIVQEKQKCIQTPTLIAPRTVKAQVKDTNENKILEKNNFETIASSKESSSNVSWTPRNKFTSSNNSIQEQVFKHNTHRSTENIDLISYQDQPQLVNSKNCLQHKFSLPAKEQQLILRTSQVSHKNELALTPNVNVSQLSISIDERDLAHLSLSAQIKEHESQDLFQKPLRSEPNLNGSTGDLSLKFKPESTSKKKASRESQSLKRKSESNCTLNDYELGAISKLSLGEKELVLKSIPKNNSFSINFPPKEYEIHEVYPKSSHKIHASPGNISLTYQPKQRSSEITLKTNQLKHDSEIAVLKQIPSILSGLKSDSNEKMSAKRKDIDFRSKRQSSLLISSFSLTPKSETNESPVISQNLPTSEPKVHQSDEPKKHKSQHIPDIEVSKSFSSTLNDSELGAIQKLSANEKNFTLKSITNKSSISLSDLPKMFKTPDLPEKSPNSYPELDNSTGRMPSKFETFSENETNNKSEVKVNKMKEKDRCSISNDVKEPESQTTCQKLLSQESLAKTNKSSANRYLELFGNDKDAVKNIFRTSPSNFNQKSNLSRSSKSSHDLNNNEPVKILQYKLEGSDVSSRSKSNSISDHNFKTKQSNKKRSEKQFKKADNSNLNKASTCDSNMLFTFPRPEEESPSVSLKSKLSNNNQTENKLDENFGQNSSLSLSNSKINEMKGTEKRVFLSDTFNQNILIEGVPRETLDLIQHLQNRVKDCDEKVKNQSKEFEKLKENCSKFESFTSIDENREEDGEKKLNDLKESAAKELLEDMAGSNEQMKPLIRNDTSENDMEEENSCHCIFCGQEKSSSDDSEEIPTFSGCECMKEDYYEIMRIAYNK